jgi:hypothetical protein
MNRPESRDAAEAELAQIRQTMAHYEQQYPLLQQRAIYLAGWLDAAGTAEKT